MKNQSGLTFVELMATILIIFITSFIVSASYPNIQKELALQRASHKITQDLRRAQQAAMSAECLSCKIIFDIGQKTFYTVLGETVNLEKGIEITNLIVDSSPVTTLTISFSPPNPTTSITGYGVTGLNAEIIISNKIRQKKVKINIVGRIE